MRKMVCISFAAIYFLLLVVSVNAQLKTPPVIEWQRSLGGSGDDWARSVQQTRDGGYIVAGYSNSTDGDVNNSFNAQDYWVVKLSSTGMHEWDRVYGGNDYDMATSIRETKDGSYIIAGYSSSSDGDVKDNNGDYDFWIIKITEKGLPSWRKSFGGTDEDKAISVSSTMDGGYIVAGTSNSIDVMILDYYGDFDYWIVKLDSNGIKEWSRSYGGPSLDFGRSIEQTSDSGYIIAGYSFSNDGNIKGHHGETNTSDYWIIKLSQEGNIEWEKSLGGSGNDRANHVKQTTDGGYIVVGDSRSIDGDVNGHFGNEVVGDMWVVKLTGSGSIEWDRSLGGSVDEEANSVCLTSDGGYVIAGYTESHDGNVSFNHGLRDFWLVKLSSTGILEWEKSFGGSQDDGASSIQQTTDGGYIVAGYSISNDGDITGNHGGYDYWIVKLSPENPSSVEDGQAAVRSVSITPNPAQTSATLTLDSDEEGICEVQIISVTGITLKQYSTRLVAAKQEIVLTDLESLPSGMYEVLVKRDGIIVEQTKLIIE